MSSDDISPGTEQPEVHLEQDNPDGQETSKFKSEAVADEVNQDEKDQYFNGLLFEEDKTGTTKLRSLLRGLKNIINERYSDSDNPDLMPDQLAQFYHDLNGDYNELFLRTPDASIAFIYKSLGCSYSLQPLPHTAAFVEPSKPALKTEGWIMWSTIQLLLGPDEHAAFLTEAIHKWDVRDPDTGKLFPKSLPRECFPAEPDKHMVAWYEGVSERLRKEAEDEAAEKERQTKLAQRHADQKSSTIQGANDRGDSASVDSRGPALAYFRNPLYRHVDGRPMIVKRGSNRPLQSPRQPMGGRGKEAALSTGSNSRNTAGLWDVDVSGDRVAAARRRDRRHGSVPNNRLSNSGDSNLEVPYEDRVAQSQMPSPQQSRIRHRPDADMQQNVDDSQDSDQDDTPQNRSARCSPREPSLRHSRSHEPTPSPRDHHDSYFRPEDVSRLNGPSDRVDSGRYQLPGRDQHRPPPIGPSFQPSDDLPFAAQIARQARREPTTRNDLRSRESAQRPHPPYDRRGSFDDRRDPREYYDRSSRRNSQDHHDVSRRPPSRQRSRQRSRARFDDRPQYDRPRPDYDNERRGYDSPNPRSQSRQRRSMSNRRSGGGSDFEGPYEGSDDRDRPPRQRQTRFAEIPISRGVDGRRYVDDAPWH